MGHKASRKAPQTETLLRSFMLAFWLMVGIASFAAPPELPAFLVPMHYGVALAIYLGFGWALWINTRCLAGQVAEPWVMARLGLQAAAGFTLNSDLLYMVAAETALVLPGRTAGIWMLVQGVLFSVWIYCLDQMGARLVLMPLPQLPHLVVMLLTDVAVFSGHGFAFFMGYLAASEIRGRRAAERLNAELAATRELLAQNSRAAERSFIARELHDTLGHHLVALKVNLELAQRQSPEPMGAALGDSFALVCRLLAEVREVVGQVKGAPGVDLRLALQTLLAGVTECSVHLKIPDDLAIRDPAHAHILFRCVQEAVTNALKHAGARCIRVELGHEPAGLRLRIQDDGRGCRMLAEGYGLAGMRERLEAAGGSLDIDPGIGRGFALTARLPEFPGGAGYAAGRLAALDPSVLGGAP
jgi:two-component system sensor histidine kinase DesK